MAAIALSRPPQNDTLVNSSTVTVHSDDSSGENLIRSVDFPSKISFLSL